MESNELYVIDRNPYTVTTESGRQIALKISLKDGFYYVPITKFIKLIEDNAVKIEHTT